MQITSLLKAHAIECLGVDLIGVCRAADLDGLSPLYVGWTLRQHTVRLRDLLPDVRSVVVLGCHVWDDVHELALRSAQKWLYPGYFPLEAQAWALALWLERWGYRAYGVHPLISLKRAAQLAGLGAYGKQSLIVTPQYGPWVRWNTVLTEAPLEPDAPFESNLCGDCDACLRVCPVGALTPYVVDGDRCLVGCHLDSPSDELRALLARYEPQVTAHTHLMCTECQKVCPLGERGLAHKAR